MKKTILLAGVIALMLSSCSTQKLIDNLSTKLGDKLKITETSLTGVNSDTIVVKACIVAKFKNPLPTRPVISAKSSRGDALLVPGDYKNITRLIKLKAKLVKKQQK